MTAVTKLTNKQQAFIEAYLACFNATQAAITAGYSENTASVTGYENLNKPQIAAAIQAHMAERCMPANEVLMRLAEQARGEHTKYISSLGSVDLTAMKRDNKMHLVKGIRPTRYGDIIEFHDSQKALELIGKHHALFTERVAVDNQVTIKVEWEELPPEEPLQLTVIEDS